MPGEVIDRPNPGPSPSHLPDNVLELAVDLKYTGLNEKDAESIALFRRASNYIAAAMIFLSNNALLERDLVSDDIKPRLLGHWGTCPGLTLVYSHLNHLIKKTNQKMIYVVGPGHGAPAVLAALWLEGTLEIFYPQYTRDARGLHNLVNGFSTPHGFPSHICAETPGAIHEGGELGYALAVAYGSVMDKPDLITAVIVGDGEAESGPTAGAWHCNKYIDPAESGAVIPILHVNGFKISERTIYGCMDDKEITALFTGFGYQVRICQDLEDIDNDLATSFAWALEEIKKIQTAARSGKPIMKPRYPMIVMRTPKGWSGPKKVDGEFVEGSFHAHQVPLMAAKTNDAQLKDLQKWLQSYGPRSLFKESGDIVDAIKDLLPPDNLKLGRIHETYKAYEPLNVPDWRKFGVEKGSEASCMHVVGKLLDQTMMDNPKSFRIFSPDELVSNKLDAVLDHTGRNFQWDEFSNARGGRVIEALSEHMMQGFLQGYTLTGRTGLFPSYESFLNIIHTMLVQYSKFNKMARETGWRADISSINYLETSTWARQEHNGFSHQNPSFIGSVLNIKPYAARVYLPADVNSFLSTMEHCLKSKNYVNLMIGSKQPTPAFLSVAEADAHCRAGASIWKFASTDEGLDPDVVLVGIGTEVTFEVISAASMLRKKCPALRVRVVNVTDLMILEAGNAHPHSLTDNDFDSLFTKDRHVHWNYHGYAAEIKGLLFGRSRGERFSFGHYNEEGSTTTPLSMMLLNDVSRYHVMQHAIRGGAKVNPKVALDQVSLLGEVRHELTVAKRYALEHGEDPTDAFAIPTFEGTVFGKDEQEQQQQQKKGGKSKEDGFYVN